MSIFSRTNPPAPKTWYETHPEFGMVSYIRNSSYTRLRLSVIPFQGLQVKMPSGVSIKRTQSFLNSKQSWILAALNQIHKTEQISKQFFTGQATIPQSQIRQTLTQRLYELADKHDFSFNNVSLRNQKSRWGSCSAKNNVSLNQKLYYLPEHLRDYVLLHELAHTHQKNHSQKFWKILHNILGINRTKQARRELKSFEFLFYPPPQAVK